MYKQQQKTLRVRSFTRKMKKAWGLFEEKHIEEIGNILEKELKQKEEEIIKVQHILKKSDVPGFKKTYIWEVKGIKLDQKEISNFYKAMNKFRVIPKFEETIDGFIIGFEK